MLDRRVEEPRRREHARMERHCDTPDAELAGEGGGVERAAAAEGEQGVLARIDAAADRD